MKIISILLEFMQKSYKTLGTLLNLIFFLKIHKNEISVLRKKKMYLKKAIADIT